MQCAQGRMLKAWEIESLLAYFWSLELKMGDLNIPANVQNEIKKGKSTDAISSIKSYYAQASPATHLDPMPRSAGDVNKSGLKPYPNGQAIYEQSCLHCHEGGRYSMFELDKKQTSFKLLNRNMDLLNHYSVRKVARDGTPSIPGKKAYMPNYTEERMNEALFEDLRAYIEAEAK